MAEEEVVAPAASPVPSDHKRKLEDLQSQPQPAEQHPLESNANSNSDADNADMAVPDETENKRPRLDDHRDGLANANGHQDEQVDEPGKETGEGSVLENVTPDDGQAVSNDPLEATTNEQISGEIAEAADAKELRVEDSGQENAEEPSKETEQPSQDSTEQDASSGDKQPNSADTPLHNAEVPYDKQDAAAEQKQLTSGSEITTRKIDVPNNKVGVLIGKAGDTIRYLQYNSGAKIQITRDADADPHSTTRSVELIGSLESIEKAEKLMTAVIAEADAGGSPSLVARGLSPAQATVGSEQIQIQVPNEKVGLIIGRGGETIKGLQTKSGARIQLIPQHLPEGDDSKERTVQVTGDKRQIEIAQELIKEVMSQPVKPSIGGFGQQGYRPPRGSGGPPQWGQRGSHFGHPTAYDYQHRGPYPSHNQPYAPPPYGSYAQHMAPRSSFGSGWEQRPHHSFQGPPPHNGGYDYYGGQGGHLPDAPPSAQLPSSAPPHGAGPSPLPSMGPNPAQVNYNYGQPQGQDYGHQAPYTQAGVPQQGYGHGYDESKFENRAPTQHPYGGHVNSQTTYPHAGAQPNFAAPQQYGKPPLYGMPSQGQPPQSYGHPRAAHSQPGDMPYQGSTPAQSYGTNMPTQQPYPYASSGPSQAAYPTYGSAPTADGYNHPPPASGPLYAQPGGQASYGQPGAQPAASYAQVGPTGYGSYPSQQTYPEQPAPSSAVYGYQAPQDPGYSSGTAPAYSAAPSGQPAYVQPTPTQTGYDQSNPQSAGYTSVPASAPAAYGKTLSPQPGYPQYDSTQVYGAPR
ncbi:far upstream element-binding protein 1-like isoform X2 [Abrus precatorius]|uniref:Far upstream element-binding protein 1-like isoform X2 n=1 Tax=Abrus precatorius TaxID=3816 RepID=A0A8B8LWE3_ABRPR|nr:far upstream element-binding protein 1-like isoform X2 [Abrus precatorius]